MKLYQRYLTKEVLKFFFLFLFTSYLLFSIFDYSMHLQAIVKSKNLLVSDLLIYYGMLFSRQGCRGQ